MTSDQDEELRGLMTTAVRDVHDTSSSLAVLQRGRRARRTRNVRRTLGAGTVAAVLGAVLIAAPAISGPTSGDPASMPLDTSIPEDLETFREAATDSFGWATELSFGAPPNAAFLMRDAVATGEREVKLPPGPGGVELVGATEDGWVIANTDPPAPATVGVLSFEGEFRPFDQVEVDRVYGSGFAPTGDRVIYGRTVYSVATGTELDRLPSDALQVIAWTPSGVAYLDQELQARLWQLGDGSGAQIAGDSSLITPDGFVLGKSHGCWTTDRLASTSLVGVYRDCESRTLALSSDGSFLLNAAGDIIDTRSASTVVHLDTPQSLWRVAGAGGLSAAFEDDTSVLIGVRGLGSVIDKGLDRGGEEGPWPAVIVRCSLSSGSCERATDAFQIDGSYPVMLPLTGS